MGSPQIYLGSDQFSICNSYEIEKGRDLSYLDIQKYQKVVVLGSKLADYMFQAQNPVGKTISIGGVNVTHLPDYKRAPYIGRVFQDPMLGTAPTMQILENLALAARR